MTVHVNEEDIAQAGPGVIGNPVAHALSRATGRRWRVWDGRVAQEMVAPYRVVALPDTVHHVWDQYADLSQMPPFSFFVQMEEEPELLAA